MSVSERISPQQFHESGGVDDWRVLSDGACAHYPATSFTVAARLVQAISTLLGVEDHCPDVDVCRDGVTVRLLTIRDDYWGMTRRDIDIPCQISTAARALGLFANPAAVQSLLIIPGATLPAEVMSFWRARLGYEPRHDSPDEDLVDPHGRGVSF